MVFILSLRCSVLIILVLYSSRDELALTTFKLIMAVASIFSVYTNSDQSQDALYEKHNPH